MKRPAVLLGVLIVAGFMLRLVLIVTTLRTSGFDWSWGGEEAAVATALATGQGFASPYWVPTGPTAIVPPLYPLLIVGLLRTLGPMHAAHVALWLNAVFSALVVVPLFLIGERLRPRAGLLASAIWALSPLLGYTEAAAFWHTSLYLLCFTTLIAWTLVLECSTSWRQWIAYGAFGGLTLLLDPAHSLAWPIALALVCWLRAVPWSRYMMVGVTSALVVVPWVIRNSETFHRPTYIRGSFTMELYRDFATDAFDFRSAAPLNPIRSSVERERYATLGEVGYLNEQGQRLEELFAQQSRVQDMRHVAHRAVVFWTGNSAVPSLYRGPEPAAFKYAVFTLWGIVGTIGLCLLRGPIAAVGWTLILVFPLPYYFALTEPRYRSPIEPLLVLLAVLGGLSLAERRTSDEPQRTLHLTTIAPGDGADDPLR